MSILGVPTLIGYTAFLRDPVGIPTIALPDGAPAIAFSLAISEAIVSQWLECIDQDIYTLAVYNLATDRLLNFAQDQAGQTFFVDIRKQMGLNSFVSGVIQSSFDQGTGESLVVPDFFKSLTLMDLQNLKTPYGRQYLSFAQMLGFGVWGLS